ncbi:hypothetical protein B0A55_07434, partial [Friedmanniomyces simplex]
MADLQELFARLKAQSSTDSVPHSQSSAQQQQQQQPSIWAQPQQTSYQQPSVSSPLFSPPIQTPNPVRSSDVISPAPQTSSSMGTPAPQEQQRTNNLLNLLKTPRPESQATTKKMEILKHDRDVSNATNGDSTAPAAKSRKLEPDTAPKSQTVAEALGDVAYKVDKQVEKALAEAGQPVTNTAAVTGDNAADGKSVKKETAEDDIESSWESAEDSANEKKAKVQVKVYNLPMKPFVTINVNADAHTPLPIRQDDFMVIAQLKKEFDQMDRSLVTASQSYIVYAQNATRKDNAGFRVIRQDTGDHKQVFRSSGERVFTVQLCSSAAPGSDLESVLGTGVNGTVFWSSLAKSRPELFAEDDVEAQGFMMPAVATPEENTSGSPVKTRAKCSSRNPDFFAMSRSKTIYVVAPET